MIDKQGIVQFAIVFFIAMLQYANTADHDYAWDDAIVLTQNARVQKGLTDIPELFENIKSNETANRYGYRPIALLSFATDVSLFGMDPGPAHKVNIVLYGILCALILLFLRQLFPNNVWIVFWVAMLYAVHPLHSEVVANIKSRDEILSLLFGLGAIMFYCTALVRSSLWFFVPSLGLFVLAFFSKESAVALCGVAALLPWFVDGPGVHLYKLKRTLPAMLILLVLVTIRVYVYSDGFFQTNDQELAQKGLFHEDGYVGNPLFSASMSERFATAFYLCAYFVYRLILPYPMVHDYSFDQLQVSHWNDPIVWIAVMFSTALVFLSVLGISRRKQFGFGLAFFIITSVIYFHIVQIAPDIFAERFLFTPSLGLCLALIALLAEQPFKRYVPWVLPVVMLMAFGVTWTRNKAWKNNETLLKTDLPRLHNCVRANYNYALMLHGEYYQVPENQKRAAAQEVLEYYERTFEITDRLFNVYVDLGAAYMEFGYPEKGKQIFELAIENYPELAVPYVQMGKYYMSFKQYPQAIPYFKRAMLKGDKNSDFNYLLAICLFNSGWYEEAISTMLEGEELGVSSSAYHSLIARLYVKIGDTEAAKSALDRGIDLYPNDEGLKNERNSILSSD